MVGVNNHSNFIEQYSLVTGLEHADQLQVFDPPVEEPDPVRSPHPLGKLPGEGAPNQLLDEDHQCPVTYWIL